MIRFVVGLSVVVSALTLTASPLAAALTTIRIAEGLEHPNTVTAPAGDDRLFIVEQDGRVRIWKDGSVLARPFLDIDDVVRDPDGIFDERGLENIVFHPDYATNGKFYVYYVDNANDNVIAEHYVSADPDSAIADSFRIVLHQEKVFGQHNGGGMAFGPNDGYLYVGFGDGRVGGDPDNNAQNPDTLLGKILRIDVDVPNGYAIPPSNPFVGDPGTLDEIWAIGVRNPFRISFDRLTSDLYIVDVGQAEREEVNFEPDSAVGGRNYGWRLMEGTLCFNPATGCNMDSSLTLPTHEYDHMEGRCSISGGAVYRGTQIPSLDGTFFFADFCTDQIWSFRIVNEQVTEFQERTSELAPLDTLLDLQDIASIGEGGHGELYIVDRNNFAFGSGEIFKIVDASTVDVPRSYVPGLQLGLPRPNPFTQSTRIDLSVAIRAPHTIRVYDSAGRLIRQLHDGQLEAGTHAFTWDGRADNGSPAPSGVYFLRVGAVTGESTRAVVLTR